MPVPASLSAMRFSNMASSMVWLRRICSGRSVMPCAGRMVLKMWSSSVCAFFLVSSLIMIFHPILKSLFRRICSSRPGDGEQRRQSLAALTACDWGLYCFQPQRMAACLTCRLDVVCPSRLGGMMQPAKAAHGAFLARRKLAASGSPRAPCAFPNLRCDPRCWYSLFKVQ